MRLPITEQDYNAWESPRAVIDGLTKFSEEDHRKRWLLDHLKEGIIVAYARNARVGRNDTVQRFVAIEKKFWRLWDEGPDYFWDTNTAVFETRDATGYGVESVARFFDVRIDVENLAGMPSGEEGEAENTEPDHDASSGKQSQLAQAEVKRFVALYSAIWGDSAKAIPAWMAAKACYPSNSIGRDYFLGIFRELRGAGKRGNPQLAKKSQRDR